MAELLRTAEACAEERRRVDAEKRAKEAKRLAREAAEARRKHLDSLVGKESQLWSDVESLVISKQPKNYDQAVKLLLDLRDLEARSRESSRPAAGGVLKAPGARGSGSSFRLRLEKLRFEHSGKPSFMQRLAAAGL